MWSKMGVEGEAASGVMPGMKRSKYTLLVLQCAPYIASCKPCVDEERQEGRGRNR